MKNKPVLLIKDIYVPHSFFAKVVLNPTIVNTA